MPGERLARDRLGAIARIGNVDCISLRIARLGPTRAMGADRAR